MVGRYIGAALEKVPHLPEWQDPAWLDRNGPARFPAGARSPSTGRTMPAQLSEEAHRQIRPAPAPRL